MEQSHRKNSSLVFEKLLTSKKEAHNDKTNTKECSKETRFHSAGESHRDQITPERFTASKTRPCVNCAICCPENQNAD